MCREWLSGNREASLCRTSCRHRLAWRLWRALELLNRRPRALASSSTPARRSCADRRRFYCGWRSSRFGRWRAGFPTALPTAQRRHRLSTTPLPRHGITPRRGGQARRLRRRPRVRMAMKRRRPLMMPIGARGNGENKAEVSNAKIDDALRNATRSVGRVPSAYHPALCRERGCILMARYDSRNSAERYSRQPMPIRWPWPGYFDVWVLWRDRSRGDSRERPSRRRRQLKAKAR